MIDIRSDTVTQPTEEMRAAMANAEVGDDVFQDDPTLNRLQQMGAELMGKQAALFLPSGSMGNQVAVMTHTRPGQEIIAGARCHIVSHELAAAAKLSGVAYAIADNGDNRVYPEDIRRLARPVNDPLSPRTGLVCLENALSDGTVVPLPTLRAACDTARELGLPVHLDGARIFNAAAALGVQAGEIAACADSVMFCLSKGLCAPVGSLLCGSREFIERAWVNRKLLGGGMRQAGVLGAAGIVALEKMTGRLAEDHENARRLGALLSEIPGIQVDQSKIHINILFFKATNPAFDSNRFVSFLLAKGIKALGEDGGEYRFVTNHGVSAADVQHIASCVAEYVAALG